MSQFESCFICMDEIIIEDMEILPCNHKLCKKCYEPFISLYSKCGICRFPFRKDNENLDFNEDDSSQTDNIELYETGFVGPVTIYLRPNYYFAYIAKQLLSFLYCFTFFIYVGIINKNFPSVIHDIKFLFTMEQEFANFITRKSYKLMLQIQNYEDFDEDEIIYQLRSFYPDVYKIKLFMFSKYFTSFSKEMLMNYILPYVNKPKIATFERNLGFLFVNSSKIFKRYERMEIVRVNK